MTSAINAANPITGTPTTQSVRDNFAAAKSEIEALQSTDQHPTIARPYADLIELLNRGADAYHCPQAITGKAPGTSAPGTGSIYFVPLRMPRSGNLKTIAVHVATPAAGNFRFGLFGPRTIHRAGPGLLLTTDTEQDANATNIHTINTDIDVVAGQILYAAVHASIALSYTALAADFNQAIDHTQTPGTSAPPNQFRSTRTYGALPSDASGLTLAQSVTAPPLYWLKYT